MVYLDYSATCPVVKYPQLLYTKLYCDTAGRECFLNPNANYAYKEKRLLSEAENRVKKAIGAKGGKVIFGGTSSQLIENLMTGMDEQTNYRHVICSAFEHDNFFRHGNVIGYSKKDLLNKLQIAKEYVTEAQKFVVWQGVNNLTGEIFPIVDIGNACHQYDVSYICDMTAMIGKVPIPANIDQWCDCAMWSGHKLGTELGIGAMWISDRLDEWLNGFKLHGTPNLAGALAMTQAVEDACDTKTLEDRNNHWLNLFWKMVEGLQKEHIHGEVYNGTLNEDKSNANEPAETTCAINAIRLLGFNARALQSYLASKEIYIGLGQSSCADEADRRVLCQGYGLSEQEADEVIRISFGEDSSVDDIVALVEGIIAFRKEYL